MTTSVNSRTGLDRFFEALSTSSFRRSDDKMIAGVCGSVAQRLGLAPKVVRIAAVVLALVGPMVAIYLLAWVLLPDSRGRTVIERALRGGETKAVALSVIAALVVLSDIGIRAEVFWPMLVVGGIVAAVLFINRRRKSLPAAPAAYGTSTYASPVAHGPAYGPPVYGQPTNDPSAPQQPYQSPQDAPRW